MNNELHSDLDLENMDILVYFF